MSPASCKRVMIFGLPGSGKSTCASQLGRLLDLPVEHLDRSFFLENWKERDHDEFLQIQKEMVAKDAWIIDGNALRSLEMRFCRADVVLYFHLNRVLCLWRLLKRLVRKDSHIADRAEGCSERVSWRFIRYLWGFHRRVANSIQHLRKKYPYVTFYEIHTDKDAKLLIERGLRSFF